MVARKRKKTTEEEGATVVSPDAPSSTTPFESEDQFLDMLDEKTKEEPSKVDNPKKAGNTVAVAPGRAITTRHRGILVSPDEVTAKDFAEGEARIEALVQAGYLVRK